MANTTDNSELARAREWLDMARPKWRLQTMQHRSRYNPRTGEYRQLPTRIRRFLNGTPVGMKSLVLELLKESAPYRTPVFDCETDEDLLYRPTNTFIRKDGPEHATNGTDPTYTIIQDLLLDDGREDSFGFADESSCAQAGSTEYHWDEPSVMDCPDGGQGVSYQITDISRDRDTDLFSYRVRRVQALTVHVPPQVTECDARKHVTVETWDNVYGTPGAYRWDSARNGGAQISVPAPCAHADGTSVKVDVYRNPDCTYRLTVQTVVAKTDPAAQFSAYQDQYKTSFGERVANAFVPLPKAGTESSGGITIRYVSERNEDGTWNNSTETETECPVQMSTVEHRVTPRGTRTDRTDTNQATPANGISTEYGSWKYTKTPGGLYNNEYVEFVRGTAGRLGVVCADTAFVKTHETRSGAASLPAPGAHVPPASGGRVTTWTYDMDDDGGITRRERTEQEHPVTYAVRRRTWGWLGTTSGFQHRSVSRELANALYNAEAAGKSVEVKLTNGGMYDVDVQTFVRVSGQRLGFECDRTIFQHSHEDVSSADSIGVEAASAGNGHTYRKSYAVDTATGAITKRERDVTELHVPESRRSVRVTARGTVVRTSAANAPSAVADATGNGEESEWEKTPGGRYNNTTTTTTPRQGPGGASCEKDAFLHSDGETTTGKNAPTGHVDGGSGGKYSERTSRLGDDGLWETTTVEHNETTNVESEVHKTVGARGMRTTTVTRGLAGGAGQEPSARTEDMGREYRRVLSRGGLWTVEDTRTEPIADLVMLKDESVDGFLRSAATGTTKRQAVNTRLDDVQEYSGRYGSRRQQLGDDGLWLATETENEEKARKKQLVETRVTKYGLVTRTTDVNQTSGAEDRLTWSVANIGRETREELTRGLRVNVTTVKVDTADTNDAEIGAACEKTAFLHTHSVSKIQRAKSGDRHVDDPAGGKYSEEAWTLTDLGTWEQRTVDRQEKTIEDDKVQEYQDAFGTTTVEASFSLESAPGREFEDGKKIVSVEAQRTNGNRFNVHKKTETPQDMDSGWLHMERSTDKGLAVYYDFIIFRNKSIESVRDEIRHAEGITYRGWAGSFASHPSASLSPNKFGLWDGTITVTTTFTPKAWAAGGTTADDCWEIPVTIKSVSFFPHSGGKMMKIVSSETHKRGGGVGKDRLKSILSEGVLKGSQFAFNPGGETFSYDIITSVTTTGQLVDGPSGTGEKILGMVK